MNLVEALEDFKESILEKIHVAKPAKITKIKNNFVDVLCEGNTFVEVPYLCFSASKNRGLFIPLKKGNTGFLLFFDNSIENFQNETVNANENHLHDLSDCIFVSGFDSDKKRLSIPENVELKNETAKITLEENKISIENDAVDLVANCVNVIQKLSDTLETLSTGLMTGSNSSGPVVWSGTIIADLGALKSSVDLLKTSLETLKR